MPSSPLLPPSSPLLEEALQRRNLLLRSQSSGKMAMMNFFLALICLYDANHQVLLHLLTSHPAHMAASLTYLVEILMFAVLITTSVTSIWNYIAPLHGLAPIPLSEDQFRLLRLHPSSPGFTKSPEKKPPTFPNPFTPLPGSLIQQTSHTSPSASITPVNLSSTSWLSSSPTSPASTPLNTSNQRREHYQDQGLASPLTDEQQLSAYLTSYRDWESSHCSLDESGSQASQSLLFWRPGVGGQGGPLDFTQGVKSVYQLSSALPASPSPGGQDKEAASDQAKVEVLSHRLGIDPLDLVSWNQNLRVWLTQTVLRPLVSEIDRVNLALPKHGVSDCLVGQVAVDRLRKVATLPQVVQGVPSLAAILPYLEVSSDQVYLLARLRQLAKTGALSLYKWDGGGAGWSDRLPTDSEVIVHCLASYMDSRLLTSTTMRMAGPSNPQAEAKPFTGVTFFKHGEKPGGVKEPLPQGAGGTGAVVTPKACEADLKDIVAIVQTGRSPVHYVVQVGSKQLDVGGGRNNLVHSVLLFLHTVKQDRHGMLGRVNLGLSGLNILWVID